MMLDRLRAESQQFLMKFPSVQTQSREVVLKSQQRLLGIFNDWELMVEELLMRQDSVQNIMKKTKQALRHERETCKKLAGKLEESKNYWKKRETQLAEDFSKFKQHLEEAKVIWDAQKASLQKSINDNEEELEEMRERQHHQMQLINGEIRELMSDIKGGERPGLLAELFSKHELDEESRVALGNPRKPDLSIDLRSLRRSESMTPDASAIETREIYTRLRSISDKINNLDDQSFSCAASSATLNQGFMESMKSSELQSARHESPKTTKHISEFSDFSKAVERKNSLDEDEISSIECFQPNEVQQSAYDLRRMLEDDFSKHQNSIEASFEIPHDKSSMAIEPDSAASAVRIEPASKIASSIEKFNLVRPLSKRKSRMDNFYDELEELKEPLKEKSSLTPLRKVTPQLPKIDPSLNRLSVRIKTRLPARPTVQRPSREPAPPQPESSSAIYHRRFVSQNQDNSIVQKTFSREAQSESPNLPTRFRLRRFREVQNVQLGELRVPTVPKAVHS
mmetsp:Transcript_34770/g.61192  ORF Transcript_34770/g.61192 Transcript_34770/m.61192 type:complete len:510 (+) Transcript_34770:110-1639(+)